MKRYLTLRRFLGGLVCSIALGYAGGSVAYSFKTIYSFCSQMNCSDGNGPEAGLLRDPAGSFYGVTTGGGINGAGAIFKLTPNHAGTEWREKVLYSFCSQESCADGEAPFGALIRDVAGNLYGTVRDGGPNHVGEAFELLLGGARPKLKILFSFCNEFETCGAAPASALTYSGASSGEPFDGASPLYGIASQGGANASGAVYQLTPPATRGAWTEQVVYSLCSQPGCADGSYPAGDAYMDSAGNLYATANSGGATNDGTIFKLSFNPTKQAWKYTLLHAFCSNCGEGSAPRGALAAADGRNLLGTTASGGEAGQGTAYRLALKGVDSQLTILHSFCSEMNCADGENPFAGLTVAEGGRLIGTAFLGGQYSNYGGTVFEITRNNTSVLYSFCAVANCADGQEPLGTMISDPSGNLFGVTFLGGAAASGTVFELSP